jgi:sugar phosphate isomerase/epimerase
LPENKKALEILKNSRIISGIETSNLNEEIELIKKAGLKVSIHNPLRNLHLGLENRNLKKNLTKELINKCELADTGLVGFHAGYKIIETNQNLWLTKIRTILNIKFLKKKINKKIIFESPPYLNNELGKRREKIASPNFVKTILKHSDGYLFDVSHNFITMKQFEKQGKNYRKEILEVTKGRVLQMHLNAVTKTPEGDYIDEHKTFQGLKHEKEELEFAKEVLSLNPQLKVITLEMSTNSSPEKHAKILVEQAKYLKKKLDI